MSLPPALRTHSPQKGARSPARTLTLPTHTSIYSTSTARTETNPTTTRSLTPNKYPTQDQRPLSTHTISTSSKTVRSPSSGTMRLGSPKTTTTAATAGLYQPHRSPTSTNIVSPARIPFPTFLAGPLHPTHEYEEFRMQPLPNHTNTSHVTSTSTTTAAYSSSHSEFTKDWKETEERVNASLQSDAHTLESMRLLTLQYHSLQSTAQRKDEQLVRLEQQIQDLTLVIDAQTRTRHQYEEAHAEQINRIQQDAELLAKLQKEFEAESSLRSRAEHERQLEQQAHQQTKQLLHEVKSEAQERGSHHANEMAAIKNSFDSLHRSEKSAQDRIRNLEQQLLKVEGEREAATKLAEQTLSKQETQIDQLTKTLYSVREEFESTQHELSLAKPTIVAYEQLKVQHQSLRDSFDNAHAELDSVTKLNEESKKILSAMDTKVKQQADENMVLQTRIAQNAGKEIELSEAKHQLASVQFELGENKNHVRSLQQSLTSLKDTIHDLEGDRTRLENEKRTQTQQEQRLKEQLQLSIRNWRMVHEQMKQMVERNPFAKRAPGSTPTTGKTNDTNSITSSSPPTTTTNNLEQEFTRIRDELNVILLDLNSQTRSAWNLFSDQALELDSVKKELVEKTSQIQLSSERYSQLEGQHFQVRQELLHLKADSQEIDQRESNYRQQIQQLNQACQLLVQAYRPLQLRYQDVVKQKDALHQSVQKMLVDEVAVARLRFDLSRTENNAPSTSSDGQKQFQVKHPYRIHTLTSRVSFRSAVITVLAGLRLARLSECRYGINLEVGSESIICSRVTKSTSSDSKASSLPSNSSPLPTIDASSLNKSAGSLAKLLDHFDPSKSSTNTQVILSSQASKGQTNLFERLISGFHPYHVHLLALTSKQQATPKNTSDDLYRIRSFIAHLIDRLDDFQQQSDLLQQQYLNLIKTSTHTEEQLQHEQQTALEMSRIQQQQSRHETETAKALIESLKRELAESERVRSKSIPSGEYQQLYETSERVLKQCRQLEQENQRLQQEIDLLKEEIPKLQQEKNEQENDMKSLKHELAEKDKALVAASGRSHNDLQFLTGECRRLQQVVREDEQQLSDSKQQIQQLQTACSNLDRERGELHAAYDATARELSRLQELVRTISQAHQTANSSIEQSYNTRHDTINTNQSTTYYTGPATSYQSGSSHAYPSSPSITKSSSLVSGLPVTVPTPIHVRHHPSGSLSIDFDTTRLPHLSSSNDTGATATHSSIGQSLPTNLSTVNGSTKSSASSSRPSSSHEPHPLEFIYTPTVSSHRFTSTPYTAPAGVPVGSTRSTTTTSALNRFDQRPPMTPIGMQIQSPHSRVKFTADTKL